MITFPPGMSQWVAINPTGLPLSIDLRTEDTPIVYQGSESSCTANAIVDIPEIWEAHNGTPIMLSRNFEYFNARSYVPSEVGVDNGAIPDLAMMAAMQYGICTEATWPYGAATLEAIPPTAAYTEALTYLITSASTISDMEQIKVAIAMGFPVVIALIIHPDFNVLSGTFAHQLTQYTPNYEAETPTREHVGVLLGYDDASGYFIFRNSWGTSWGDVGYGALPYSVFSGADVQNCYVITGYRNYTMPQPWGPSSSTMVVTTSTSNALLTVQVNVGTFSASLSPNTSHVITGTTIHHTTVNQAATIAVDTIYMLPNVQIDAGADNMIVTLSPTK
jgi:hypothetical protein